MSVERAPNSTIARNTVLGGGRLGAYAALGAATGVVPLPWLPDAMVRRIRGALVHDVTARNGVTLTADARRVLVHPRRSLLEGSLAFAATRLLARFGPAALLSPLRMAIGTFALGHLLERYVTIHRTERATRMDAEEARRVRRAIEQAVVYAVATDASPKPDNRPPLLSDDLRDPVTQLLDSAITSIASGPDWLVRRLDQAFDETLSHIRA